MSDRRTAASGAQRVGSGANRVVRAWRALAPEPRLAALACIGLFTTLFLPWYQVTVIATGRAAALQSKSVALTGWGAFSFVEAAVLIVAAGVLTMLFQRAEGRAFHLPGGDGWVILAAGFWTCVLIVWRIFDKQGTRVSGPGATTSGIEWGIFVALAVAALLAYAGSRIRAAHEPEPPLPDAETPRRPPPASPEPGSRRVRPPRPVAADDPPTERLGRSVVHDDPPTLRIGPSVVPDDPPTMRFGTPSTPVARRRKVAPDEQLTIPLEGKDTEDP